MSHVAQVNVLVKDLDALAEAAEKLGGTLVLGQTKFRFYSSMTEPCIHAIQMKQNPKGYEVGLRWKTAGNEEDGYTLHRDAWDGTIDSAFGKDCGKLNLEYSALVAEKQLRKTGHRVRRDESAAANQVRLVAVR